MEKGYPVFREFPEKKGRREPGVDDVVDTPVPMPNTEVKHHSGYGIRKERAASRRTLPFFPFFCFMAITFG